jgi:hypothetical protein
MVIIRMKIKLNEIFIILILSGILLPTHPLALSPEKRRGIINPSLSKRGI